MISWRDVKQIKCVSQRPRYWKRKGIATNKIREAVAPVQMKDVRSSCGKPLLNDQAEGGSIGATSSVLQSFIREYVRAVWSPQGQC